MILTGTAGGGKSTLMEVFENVIGPLNVYELRTAHLHERFEQARFIQKTVLTGKDVPGDFLEQEGAHVIKKLVGHDLLSAEKKGSNADIPFVGNFGVGITCNSRLRVRLDGDDNAWERRLMIVKYAKPKPKQRILNLADYLMKQEAAGILRWMVDGAIEHLRECDANGDYRLTAEQTDHVVQLLAESDSLRLFVIDCIQESQDGSDLSTTEIISAYFDYCAERKWAPFPSKRAERNLADLMLEIHHSARGTHVMRGDKRVNGYRNVELS